MKLILTIVSFFIILAGCPAFAQNSSDSVEVEKVFLGTQFYQNDLILKPKDLMQITENNPEAHQFMKTAKTNYVVSSIFSFAGGALVGWPLGTMVGGGEPNWALAGIGAGLIVVSVPFSTVYTKKAKRAVEIYNTGLSSTSFRATKLNFAITGNGLGLKVSF